MKYLFLSYPRSGNTWIRYFVEYISGLPTIGYPESFNRFDCPLIHKKAWHDNEIMVKRHSVMRDLDRIDRYDGLVLALRNPKECIVRHVGKRVRTVLENFSQKRNIIDKTVDGYMANIKFFDEYKGRKKVVYYEDFILNKKPVYFSLANFLGYEVGDFFENIDSHKEKCLLLYKDGITKGKSVTYHAQKNTSDALDKSIKGDELAMKYLSRYL